MASRRRRSTGEPSTARRRGQEWRAERFEDDAWPTLAIVRRQFGTMSDALHAAGLRPQPRPVQPRGRLLSREDILHAIREWSFRAASADARLAFRTARGRRDAVRSGILAIRVRAVADARQAQDPLALRSALLDLATAALSWADAVAGVATAPVACREAA
jgi:hypothetical protein